MTDYDVAPGWYLDPSGQGEARYWNGASWTSTISREGATLNVAIDPAHAAVPPIPGTEVHLPIPLSTQYAVEQPAKRSSAGTIIAMLVALVAVVALFAVISSNNSSDDTPPAPSEPPATAAPSTEAAPAEGG